MRVHTATSSDTGLNAMDTCMKTSVSLAPLTSSQQFVTTDDVKEMHLEGDGG